MSEDRACSGKKRYRTPEEAKSAAEWVRNRRDEKTSPYHCPHCHGWHLRNTTEAAHYWGNRQRKRASANRKRRRG